MLVFFNAPVSKFDPNSGVKVGNPSEFSVGTIRYNTYFEIYADRLGVLDWYRLDKLGNFTGSSLFPEDELVNPAIFIDATGNVGINSYQIDQLSAEGTTVLGSSNASDLSSITGGDYFIWSAKPAALRIGFQDSGNQMFTNIGEYSVGLGYNTSAAGEGSVNINFPDSEYKSSTQTDGDYSVVIGSDDSSVTTENSIIVSSIISSISENNIVFSHYQASAPSENSIMLSGYYGNLNHSNTVVGGYLYPRSIGENSFFVGRFQTSQTNNLDYNHSFSIGNRILVGINTDTPTTYMAGNTSLDVNGGASTTGTLHGSGAYITNVQAEYVYMFIDGVREEVYATYDKTPQYLYISDSDGFLPAFIVTSNSIADGTLINDNFANNLFDSSHIVDYSINTEDFASESIPANLIFGDSMPISLFSNLDGNNFEDSSIDEHKLATDSIDTIHFSSQSVTTRNIDVDQITGIQIKDSGITTADVGYNQFGTIDENNTKYAIFQQIAPALQTWLF